jgi:hypothetical protein
MQVISLKEFSIRFQRNENKISPGTVLSSEDGAYFRFGYGLALLLERDAIDRLCAAGALAWINSETTGTALQAAE